jgi:hypothetical protein
MKIPAECAIWSTRATRATAIAGWEVGLPRLSALPASCTDDHTNHRRLMHGIEGALIGTSATRGN